MSAMLLLLIIFVPAALAGGIPQVRPPQPKLVLVIVVDQMRSDYLTRFGDLFCEGGFNLLIKRGATFTNCAYDYAATYTAPGHSTILSGIPIRLSGIIGNEWFDREQGRRVYCMEDPGVSSVGIGPDNAAGRMSPRNFQGTTIGDQLLIGSPSSRVMGIAIKDRSAILLAGQHPTGAFWFDPGAGNWISSSYYYRALPSWVEKFNGLHVAEDYLGRTWTRLLPDSCYLRASADDAPGEGTLIGEDEPLFPHVVNASAKTGPEVGGHARSSGRFDVLLPTPYGNELTLNFSKAAIDGEQLGRRGVTDLLAVSLSSPDYCGHTFGPDSQEMEDLLVRLDRELQEFFAFVDSRIGLQNVMIVLTADHGVCPLPERTSTNSSIRINPEDFLRDVKTSVGRDLSYDEENDSLVVLLSNGFIHLDARGIAAHGFELKSFQEAVIRAASREEGIVRCYTRSELTHLITDANSNDSLGLRIARSFNAERSGDIALLTAEYSFFSGETEGTTHGSPYEYDRHVPLMFFGAGIEPGRYDAPCRPNDIAATLAVLLRLETPPGSDGIVLGLAADPQTASVRAHTRSK